MAARHDTSKPTVLVAEDEELTGHALRDCLLEQNFDVILTGDGVQALERAALARFDVLLTDLRMPHMGGQELIRCLRARRPDLPVVVMTGHPAPDWQQQLQQPDEGPMVLLTKPVHLQGVLDALRSVMDATPRKPPGDPIAAAPAA